MIQFQTFLRIHSRSLSKSDVFVPHFPFQAQFQKKGFQGRKIRVSHDKQVKKIKKIPPQRMKDYKCCIQFQDFANFEPESINIKNKISQPVCFNLSQQQTNQNTEKNFYDTKIIQKNNLVDQYNIMPQTITQANKNEDKSVMNKNQHYGKYLKKVRPWTSSGQEFYQCKPKLYNIQTEDKVVQNSINEYFRKQRKQNIILKKKLNRFRNSECNLTKYGERMNERFNVVLNRLKSSKDIREVKL